MNKALLLLLIMISLLFGQQATTIQHTVSLMPKLELVVESGDNQYCAVNSSPAGDLVMRIRYAAVSEPPVKKNSKVITYPSVLVNVEVLDPDGISIKSETVSTDASGLGRYKFTAGDKLGEYIVRCKLDTSLYPEFTGRYQIEFKVKTKLTLEVKNGEEEITENSYDKAYITETPTMPDIRAGVKEKNLLTGNMQYKLSIEYSRELQSHTEHFPSNVDEYYTLPITDIWDVNFGTLFRGGTAIIQYKHESESEWSNFIFFIRGEGDKPTEAVVKSYIGSDPWFLTRLVRQESSYNQFNPGIPGPNNVYGHPNFGSPNGWGLMMPDPPGLTTGECAQRMWNWKENCERGITILLEKDIVANQWFTDQVDQWEEWNSLYPLNAKPVHEDQIEGTIPNIQITFSHFPIGDQKPFRDAIWMKCYNGASNGHYLAWENTGDAALNPYWKLNRLNSDGINYVNDVCSEQP